MSKLLKKYTVRKKGDTCEALWSRDIEIKVHVNYHFCYIFDKIQKMTDFFHRTLDRLHCHERNHICINIL